MIDNIESQLDQWAVVIGEHENSLAQAEGRLQANIKRLKVEFKKKSLKEGKELQKKHTDFIKEMRSKIEADFKKLKARYDY